MAKITVRAEHIKAGDVWVEASCRAVGERDWKTRELRALAISPTSSRSIVIVSAVETKVAGKAVSLELFRENKREVERPDPVPVGELADRGD